MSTLKYQINVLGRLPTKKIADKNSRKSDNWNINSRKSDIFRFSISFPFFLKFFHFFLIFLHFLFEFRRIYSLNFSIFGPYLVHFFLNSINQFCRFSPHFIYFIHFFTFSQYFFVSILSNFVVMDFKFFVRFESCMYVYLLLQNITHQFACFATTIIIFGSSNITCQSSKENVSFVWCV